MYYTSFVSGIFAKTQVCYINHLSRFWELIHLKHSLYVSTNNINEWSEWTLFLLSVPNLSLRPHKKKIITIT